MEELQLGLSLPITHNYIKGLDLIKNEGLNPKDRIGKLDSWSLTTDDHVCVDTIKKRSFDDACGGDTDDMASHTLPLLLWSGQPNEDGGDHGGDNTCREEEEVEEEEDGVVGWPPIKSWRKKLLHDGHQQQQQQGGHDAVLNENNRVGREFGNCGSNSMYVKVKMEGVGLTRKVDLSLFNSYHSLSTSLINLFGKKPEKEGENYTLTYQDRDGDWLLAGDVPWQTFMQSVQRLEILRNGS